MRTPELRDANGRDVGERIQLMLEAQFEAAGAQQARLMTKATMIQLDGILHDSGKQKVQDWINGYWRRRAKRRGGW